MKFLESGCGEDVKCAVHCAALGLALAMGLYNVAAWWQRRERHLALNAALYGGLVAFEVKKVRHHCAR